MPSATAHFTASTKERLESLEREKSELSVQIMKEELSRPNFTKELILFWIHKFRKLNPKKLEHRRRLINSFLNSVYLFDDKIIIDCNYKDGTETITFEEIENSALGSDLTSLAAPSKKTSNWECVPKDSKKISGVTQSGCTAYVRFMHSFHGFHS